ncbi:MAG: ABC transporter permease, partial [Chlorobi bacterium]|nr:ABC transporter permease [Chlorobiota bacterium]
MITQIKQSIRSLRRSPFLVFVSMPGLIIGLAASLFLIFYIQFQSSFDEHFPNKQRVVRLYNRDLGEGNATVYPICLREAYTEIPKQIPEIEAATQIYPFGRNNVYFNGKQFNNQLVLNVDPEFFNVFGLNLTEGNRNEALKQKNSVVLSASLAKKLCSSNDCTGKVIKIGDDEFTITGIIKDLPVNTHFHFDLLASMSTLNQDYFGGLEFYTYYLLKKNSDFTTVNKKISKAYNKILKNHFTGFMEHPGSGIEPLTRLHMHTIAAFDLSEKADVKGMYIMSALALFILLIAIINHINLFVLYGEKRSSEIGIRKSLGAGTSELSVQFYFETTLFVLLAFILAYLTVAAFSPEIANRVHIGLSQFRFINPVTIGGSILLLILIIALSGSYPAFYLSRLNVISAIKGNSGSVHRKKLLAVIAVLIQFTISIFLISVLIIIHS